MVTEGQVVGVVVRGVTGRAGIEEDSETRMVVKTHKLANSNLNSVADSVVDVVLLLRDSKCSRRCFFSFFPLLALLPYLNRFSRMSRKLKS